MSSKRFEVDIGLNASGVIQGATDGKKALADLEEAVGGVADESAKSGGKVDSFASKLVDASRKAGKSDDDIKDALRQMGLSAGQAERAVEDIGDEFKETGREGDRAADKLEDSLRDVQRQSKDTDRAVGDIGENGFRKMGDAGKEVSGELRQNLGETFSSFRGDLEDLPQIAQDTLGGLAGSGALGGIPGLVATAAGAAGIGLLIGAFDQASEAQERLKEASADWASTFIENGSKVLSTAQIVAKGQELLAESYSAVEENARLWGTTEQTALAAMSGSSAALDEVTAALDRKKTAAEEDAQAAQELAEANGSALLSLTPLEVEYQKGVDKLNDLTGAMQNGATQADTFSYFLRDLAENTVGASTVVDEFGDKVTSLPDGTTIYIDAETGQATTDTDAIEKKIYGLPDSHNTNVTVTTADAITAAQNAVNAINGMSATIDIRAAAGNAIAAAQAAVNRITNMGWDK